MSTSALTAPAAQDEIATLFVAFELSKATWLIGLYSPQLGKTISRYKVDGGDMRARPAPTIALPSRPGYAPTGPASRYCLPAASTQQPPKRVTFARRGRRLRSPLRRRSNQVSYPLIRLHPSALTRAS